MAPFARSAATAIPSELRNSSSALIAFRGSELSRRLAQNSKVGILVGDRVCCCRVSVPWRAPPSIRSNLVFRSDTKRLGGLVTAVIPLVQSDNHHVQANLPAAKTTTHTIRNRNIETAKLACFLNSLRPSLIRVVRRKKIERMKRKIGIAAARKAMILKIILSVLLHGPCCPFHDSK